MLPYSAHVSVDCQFSVFIEMYHSSKLQAFEKNIEKKSSINNKQLFGSEMSK
jgi:hypothetical protein